MSSDQEENDLYATLKSHPYASKLEYTSADGKESFRIGDRSLDQLPKNALRSLWGVTQARDHLTSPPTNKVPNVKMWKAADTDHFAPVSDFLHRAAAWTGLAKRTVSSFPRSEPGGSAKDESLDYAISVLNDAGGAFDRMQSMSAGERGNAKKKLNDGLSHLIELTKHDRSVLLTTSFHPVKEAVSVDDEFMGRVRQFREIKRGLRLNEPSNDRSEAGGKWSFVVSDQTSEGEAAASGVGDNGFNLSGLAQAVSEQPVKTTNLPAQSFRAVDATSQGAAADPSNGPKIQSQLSKCQKHRLANRLSVSWTDADEVLQDRRLLNTDVTFWSTAPKILERLPLLLDANDALYEPLTSRLPKDSDWKPFKTKPLNKTAQFYYKRYDKVSAKSDLVMDALRELNQPVSECTAESQASKAHKLFKEVQTMTEAERDEAMKAFDKSFAPYSTWTAPKCATLKSSPLLYPLFDRSYLTKSSARNEERT